ncbi:MAG: signal peptidase I, partial [Halioglobus sp.]
MAIDFPLILVLLVFGSGLIWSLDALFLAPARKRNVLQLRSEYPDWDDSKSAQA